MGYVNIQIGGSLLHAKPRPETNKQFPAMELGHAAAITDAIAYLASLLPAQIALDHALHAEGAEPALGFGLPRVLADPQEGDK